MFQKYHKRALQQKNCKYFQKNFLKKRIVEKKKVSFHQFYPVGANIRILIRPTKPIGFVDSSQNA